MGLNGPKLHLGYNAHSVGEGYGFIDPQGYLTCSEIQTHGHLAKIRALLYRIIINQENRINVANQINTGVFIPPPTKINSPRAGVHVRYLMHPLATNAITAP